MRRDKRMIGTVWYYAYLENGVTVLHVGKQVVDVQVTVVDGQAVDPHPEHLLLSGVA